MKFTFASLAVAAILMTASSAKAIDMPALAKKNNCVACHAIDHKVVGPAWMDVSRKYKNATTYTYRGKEYPLFEGLVMKVSRGGSGNWGSMPMPGNSPAVKDADIRQLVKFVLNLAK
jgi:cytochrome c